MSENKKIIRFYDDKNELLKNTPLFIIAEKFDLEYYQLNSWDESATKSKVTFNKFTWNGEKYCKKEDAEVKYDNSREYLIAFDVLWEKNNKALEVDKLLKEVEILKSESIKGIIVYTRMGARDQVNTMQANLKSWLAPEDSKKVNDRFIKIGTTDPYMNIKSLVNLAEEIFKNTEGESNGRKESL